MGEEEVEGKQQQHRKIKGTKERKKKRGIFLFVKESFRVCDEEGRKEKQRRKTGIEDDYGAADEMVARSFF